LSPSRVVVTGGAGFIGSHLVDALLDAGHEVVAFDNLRSGHRANLEVALARGARLVEGDVCDGDAVRAVVAGARWVFHEAALVSVAESVEEPELCDAINGRGTWNVLLAARDAGVERVVFAASAAAYGRSETVPKHETDPVDPVSPYAATKLLGEHLATVFTATYGLPVVPLRYFNVYGPRQDPRSMYAGVISRFVDVLARGEQPTVLGDGLQTRDFIYVGDVVRANLLALSAPAASAGRPINIGTGRAVSLLALIEALAEIFDVRAAPSFGPARAGDVRHSRAAVDLARELLGFEAQTSLADGLRTLVASVVGRG
jgi:UDP-glucose 4-epimerase